MLSEKQKRINEHSKNFNKELQNIKNYQSELNGITEIKNTLEGTNIKLGDTEEHMNNLEDKIMKST